MNRANKLGLGECKILNPAVPACKDLETVSLIGCFYSRGRRACSNKMCWLTKRSAYWSMVQEPPISPLTCLCWLARRDCYCIWYWFGEHSLSQRHGDFLRAFKGKDLKKQSYSYLLCAKVLHTMVPQLLYGDPSPVLSPRCPLSKCAGGGAPMWGRSRAGLIASIDTQRQ